MVDSKDEAPGTFVMGESGPTHYCQKHGDIKATVSIFADADHERTFCMQCIDDLLEDKIGTVVEIDA